jgi:GT2 family glycosyltransferase
MKIAYVCTNYNNSRFTLAAVESLMKNEGHKIEVVVVDNASGPTEVEQLRQLAQAFPCVEVMEHPENVGYFRGLNLGLSALRTRRPDIAWVVAGNNDLIFDGGFCDAIERAAPTLKAHSVVSPDIVTSDGQHQNPHVISRISKPREFIYDLYYSNYHLGRLIHKLARMFPRVSERTDEEQWRTARPIHQGHGSCYLLTPRFFSQFSQLWAPTFLMHEEFFLSKQLEAAGEQVFYAPEIQVTHRWHGALDNLPDRRRWEMARDAHREYRKYVGVFRQRGHQGAPVPLQKS